MKSIKFIINVNTTYASKFSKQKTIAALSQYFQLSFESTTQTRNATAIAKRAIADKVDVIVAVGGNGTLFEVVQAIYGHDIPVGFIPTGYAKTISNNLNISTNLKESLQIIKNGKIKEIDLIELRNDKNSFYATSYAGFALSAKVIEQLEVNNNNTFKKYWGTILNTIPSFQRKELTISFENVTQQIYPLSFLVSNVPSVAYNRTILPEAKLDDGFVNVIHVEHHLNRNVFFALKFLFLNSKRLKPHAHLYKIDKMKIVPKDQIAVQLDLELFYMSGEINIEVIPRALKIFVP